VIDADEIKRPWHDRPRTILDVDDSESLASILDRAGSRFSLVENGDWSQGWGSNRFVAFYDDASDLPLDRRLTRELTLVDPSGRARWGVFDFQTVTYADIRSAVTSGALEGDPDRIYFNVSSVPAGGAVFPQWDILTAAWEAAWHVLNDAAAIWGGWELYRAVRDRLRGRGVVRRDAAEWLQRNGWPTEIEQMLDGRPWRPRDLAGLLGCTTPEAEAILSLYGYGPGPEFWVYEAGNQRRGIPTTQMGARTIVAYRQEVILRYADDPEPPEDDLQKIFTTVFEQAEQTGDVILPYERLEDERDQV
jgi:hypothetical protein